MWIAFCGGDWLWEGSGTEAWDLGDMVGPFESWTAAATWALAAFPLEGTLDQQRETLAPLIRRVDPPGSWSAPVPLSDLAQQPGREVLAGIRAEMAAAAVALEAEQDLFWSERQRRILAGEGL